MPSHAVYFPHLCEMAGVTLLTSAELAHASSGWPGRYDLLWVGKILALHFVLGPDLLLVS